MSSETGEPSPSDAPGTFWARVHEHKVIQWGIGYFGAALAVAHGAELVTHALHWPDVVWRILVLALIVGFPIALTIAWYHGHRGLKQIGAGELAIVSALMLIGAVFFTAALRPDEDGVEAAESDSAVPEQSQLSDDTPSQVFLPNSVAVLPLESLSQSPGNFDIAAGLHQEILGQLDKNRSLTVIARTSVLQYADERPPIPEIGRALRAQSIMEGSVGYADDRIRVTTRLVDSVTGSLLWSEIYERDFDDGVFTIQSDIAISVANKLKAAFSEDEQRRIEQVPMVSGKAYAAYLRVLPEMARSNQAPQILALLNPLIADAPEFAPLHGWKAFVYANLLINSVYGPARDPAETQAAARTSAASALDLDPQEGRATSALAMLALVRWRWAEARRAYEDYAQETGDAAEYHEWLNSWSDRPGEALAIARRAVDVDPLNPIRHWYLGSVLTYAHDYDAATASFERAIEILPSTPLFRSWLAFAEIGRGNHEAAARSLASAEDLLAENREILYLVDILYSYGRIGRREDATRVFNEIEGMAANQEIGAGGRAMAYLGVGDHEKALEQLRIGSQRARDKILDPGFFSLMNIRMNVAADPVLEQPEFAAVRAELTGD